MIREVGFIVDYGYDVLTADVVQTLKLHFRKKNKNILADMDIHDAAEWSIKEQNLLQAFVTHKKEYRDFFSQSYNGCAATNLSVSRLRLLKELNAYKNFFNIYPYSKEKQMEFTIYKMIMDNHLGRDIERNMDLIKEGLKQFCDVDTMKKVVGDIMKGNTESESTLVIDQGNLIRKSSNKKTNMVKLCAAAISIPAAHSVSFPLLALARTALHDITFSAQILTAIGAMGGSFMAYYAVKRIIENVHVAEENKKIRYMKIVEVDSKEKSRDLVAYELCQSFIHNRKYDSSSHRGDVLVFCFLNEKLNSLINGTPLPEKLVAELTNSLKSSQVKRLLELDFNDIQKLSTIKNNEIRKIFLFSKLSHDESNIFRLLDQSLFISDRHDFSFKKIKQGQLPSEVHAYFNDKEVSTTDKSILKIYLELNHNKSGTEIFPYAFEGILNDGQLNKQKIHKDLQRIYEIKNKVFLISKEKTVVHRIIERNVINDTKERIRQEELKKINDDIVRDIKQMSLRYDCKQTWKTIKEMPSVIEDVIPSVTTTAVHTVDNLQEIPTHIWNKMTLK